METGACSLSDDAVVTILDAVTGDGPEAPEAGKEKVVESLGRAYAYLSERQDGLQAQIDAIQAELAAITNKPNNIIKFPCNPTKAKK